MAPLGDPLIAQVFFLLPQHIPALDIRTFLMLNTHIRDSLQGSNIDYWPWRKTDSRVVSVALGSRITTTVDYVDGRIVERVTVLSSEGNAHEYWTVYSDSRVVITG